MRTAVTVALPAFVASRILSRPLVATMVDHFCAATGASREAIMAEYDARTDEATSRLASTHPTASALELLAKLDEALAESHLLWQNVLSGSEPAMRDLPPSAPRHARGITPDDGDGDEEHPHTRKRTKIQGIITAHIDSGVREGLLQMHEGEGSWAARTRLAELGDPNVDHTWLWRLNSRHSPTLDADEYVHSVRFRLGCAGPAEPVSCAACNSGTLDTGAAHASCCALGEATRGHNAVSSLIHAAALQCDHTSEMEVPGLIPGTDLRPADIPHLGSGQCLHGAGRIHLLPSRSGGWHRLHTVQGRGQTGTLRPSPGCPPSTEHFLHPDRVERLRATSCRHVDRFALSQQIHHVQNATLPRLRSYSTGCTRASHWKYGDAAHGKYAHAGP